MKTNEEELLDADAWEGAHLSEVALSCLADGQDVINAVARVHAESCAACALRIGAMALESHEIAATLRVAREASRVATPAHRFPTALVAAAVVIAAACGIPAFLEAVPRALEWAFAAPRLVPLVTTSAVSLAKGMSGASISLVTTFTFALAGYAVVRASRNTGASR